VIYFTSHESASISLKQESCTHIYPWHIWSWSFSFYSATIIARFEYQYI